MQRTVPSMFTRRASAATALVLLACQPTVGSAPARPRSAIAASPMLFDASAEAIDARTEAIDARAGAIDAVRSAIDARTDAIDARAEAIDAPRWVWFTVPAFGFEAPDTLIERPFASIDSEEHLFEVDGITIATQTDEADVRDARRSREALVLDGRAVELSTLEGSNGGAFILRWASRTRVSRDRRGRRAVLLDLSPTTLWIRWPREEQRAIARRIAASLHWNGAARGEREPPMADAGPEHERADR